MESELCFEIPCARTDHGALPRPETMSNESPIPKINKPKMRMQIRESERSHWCEARHGVMGIVGWGRKKLINLRIAEG
ncbi:MAG: hypothetical protein EBX85_02690 [Actinobacteria bacterium]|nr:hypothetical protein [Actinomycetota bacterium]